jgi:GT2 family glycosyltransferase
VLLVPRRAGEPTRDRIWAFCKLRWETVHPEWPIYEGNHDVGSFNRSAAMNTAARLADADAPWDIAVVIDADIFIEPSHVREAVRIAAETGHVTWAHRKWRGLTKEATMKLIEPDLGFELDVFGRPLNEWDGEESDVDIIVGKTTALSWSCCFAIPRAAWEAIGGFDERFRGWGFEDMAFQSAAVAYGHERVEGNVYHFWHPRTSGVGTSSKGLDGNYSAEAIYNARLGRRYMVALRRDYGKTDRLKPSDEAELKRDIANLVYDDTQLAEHARRLGLEDWDGWWPTLNELRDGSGVANQSVTVVVHTDGRREYIEQSIPSLLANVKGNITKRVIYDDSGDYDYKQWLRHTFPDFYVVGPEARLGYTGSMRAMWTYLSRRCDSRWVFLAEDDFTYDQPVELEKMAQILTANPHLRQLALLRHPFYPREFEAGSILKEHPEAYTQRDGFIEHREYFTANPSLFARDLVKAEMWPAGPSSERLYTDQLNHDPASRMAYLGSGEELVTHIGAVRAGGNY